WVELGRAVMDIVVWLRSLGLGRYEAAFRENDIDETVLPGLTHETLKELGVTAVRRRLKLLDAIAALRSDASGATFRNSSPASRIVGASFSGLLSLEYYLSQQLAPAVAGAFLCPSAAKKIQRRQNGL